VISEAGAQQVLKAAEAEAERLHAASAIAVVDESGILVAFLRMDGVRPGSPELAIGKARTAAMLRRPSGETEDNIDNGRYAFITSGFMSLRGGIPILSRGEVIGAVGVAGIDKDQDVRIAQKAADAIKDAIKDALKDQASPPTHP
jgi:glc operon protein GlcG